MLKYEKLIKLWNCPLCGSPRWWFLKKESHIQGCERFSHIVKCMNCGLRFMDPQPHYLYEKEFENECRNPKNSTASVDYLLSIEDDVFRKRLENIGRHIAGRAILDVGCGRGNFLRVAKAAAWMPMGLEISERMTARLVEEGFNVYLGALELALISKGAFDAIHMSNVLEHVEDPVETLQACHRVLCPGGILAIEVPHEFTDLVPSVLEWVGKKRAIYLKPEPHIFFYSPRTLTKMLRKCGFEVLELRTPRYYTKGKNFAATAALKALAGIEGLLKRGPVIDVIARKIKN